MSLILCTAGHCVCDVIEHLQQKQKNSLKSYINVIPKLEQEDHIIKTDHFNWPSPLEYHVLPL